MTGTQYFVNVSNLRTAICAARGRNIISPISAREQLDSLTGLKGDFYSAHLTSFNECNESDITIKFMFHQLYHKNKFNDCSYCHSTKENPPPRLKHNDLLEKLGYYQGR